MNKDVKITNLRVLLLAKKPICAPLPKKAEICQKKGKIGQDSTAGNRVEIDKKIKSASKKKEE
jgi:hypothetical protein